MELGPKVRQSLPHHFKAFHQFRCAYALTLYIFTDGFMIAFSLLSPLHELLLTPFTKPHLWKQSLKLGTRPQHPENRITSINYTPGSFHIYILHSFIVCPFLLVQKKQSWGLWHLPVIPSFRRLKQDFKI